MEIELQRPQNDEYLGKNRSSQMTDERLKVTSLLAKHGVSIKDLMLVSNLSGLRYFTFAYGTLVAVFVAWKMSTGPWSLLALLAIPFVQHAFFNTVHEASHFLLNRKPFLNDLYGNCFAFPIGTTVESYRIVHVDHHRYLNTEKDPSFVTVQQGRPSGEVIKNLLLGLCGRYLFLLVLGAISGNALSGASDAMAIQRKRFKMMLVFHLTLLWVAIVSGAFFFWLAWVVSANSLLPLLESIRTIVEHRRMRSDSPDLHTRSHHINGVLSAVSAPFFQFHWEHHLFPSIPHYNLEKLHRILIAEHVPDVRPKFFYRILFQILIEDLRKK